MTIDYEKHADSLWWREFGEGWEPPAAVLSALERGAIQDRSWSCDPCPKFSRELRSGAGYMVLYVDREDPPQRVRQPDESHAFRYKVVLVGRDFREVSGGPAYLGDDLNQALATLLAPRASGRIARQVLGGIQERLEEAQENLDRAIKLMQEIGPFPRAEAVRLSVNAAISEIVTYQKEVANRARS